MFTLAMDTAGTACAACLYDSGSKRVLARMSEEIGRGHAERLMGLIADVLKAAGISYTEIGKIVTTIGPGSFTGIRVGVATARGFGVGLGIPVVGVTNLEAMIVKACATRQPDESDRIGVVMEAGRGQVYCQFTLNTSLGTRNTPFMASIDALAESLQRHQEDLVLCGTAAENIAAALAKKPVIIEGLKTPPIEVIAMIGADRKPSESSPEPLYLRKPDAKPQTGFAVARSS